MSSNPKYFQRKIEFSNGILTINQSYIGDVGHVVWDAAISLAKFIDGAWFTDNKDFIGKNVVELGSGTGLVGMVAAMHGATVRITDLEELKELMDANLKENEDVITGNISSATLKWGEDFEKKWNADIILIADCIYYEESLEPLIQTMSALCHPDTEVFMSYEERDTELKIALQKKFFQLAEDVFKIECVPRGHQDPIYSSDDIHLLRMTLK